MPKYKYGVGERVRVCGMLLEIVALAVYHSEALDMDLPMYTVKVVMGSRLDSSAFDIHEGEIR